jgi:hypothetical protein
LAEGFIETNASDGDIELQSLAIADTIEPMSGPNDVAAALRQIARGFEALAAAVAGESDQPSEALRALAVLREWGDRGLTRAEASALFRKHGFAPQTAGGWARGDWIESREDGLRYITERSRRSLAEQEVDENG